MEKLVEITNRIQKEDNLNRVFYVDEKGPGGAKHVYEVFSIKAPEEKLLTVNFQKGPRSVEGSVSGVLDNDLLEIVRDRLTDFSKGDLPSEETKRALYHVEEALYWLNRRKEDRKIRGVLGTNLK